MHKAGVVFAEEFREFFRPYNEQHMTAYLRWKMTGRWPEGFLPDTVWFLPGWEEWLDKHTRPVAVSAKTEAILAELKRVHDIVGKVKFPLYTFVVDTMSDHFFVQVKYREEDVLTGVDEEQKGRKWAFPAHQTEDQIVQTCFKAILTSMEHRVREHFTYQDEAVMCPHRNMAEVVASLKAKRGGQ